MNERTQPRTVSVDPVLSEILAGACRALVEEADDLLERASMGMVIRESRDYCSVVCDRHGNVVATGSKDLPAFVGTIQFTMQAVIAAIGVARFRPGDIYIVNDPWTAGTHFNDMRLVAPVFSGERLIGYVGSCGHVTDIGGINPGSFAIRVPTHHAEGLRVPPVLFYRDGQVNEDVAKLILGNIRVPELTEGDLHAMTAAIHRASERLLELAATYGPDLLDAWMQSYLDYGEEKLREKVAALADGCYEWTDWIDENPASGEPVQIKLAIRVAGDQLSFDFTGSDPQTKSAVNSPFPATAAIVYTVTASLFPEVPMSHGLMRAISIVAPAGTVVHASYPTAVSAMATTTFDVLVACIVGAFSQVIPERTIAASYNLQTFVTSGVDPKTGGEFITYAWGPGGWGASQHADGRTAMSIYTTTTTVTPCEAEERRIPFVIEELAIVPDSGGIGRRRGGNCVRRVVRFDYVGLLTSLAGRGRFPIWGLFGGGAGQAQTAVLSTRDGERELGLLAEGVKLAPGDRLIYTNGGGGGFGPALEREPARVLDDVLDGWITPEQARSAYGVVLREVPETSLTTSFEIDEEATARLRCADEGQSS